MVNLPVFLFIMTNARQENRLFIHRNAHDALFANLLGEADIICRKGKHH